MNLHLSSYYPNSTLGTVGTMLNMICVVVAVNIVSFFIVKVCLLPLNTMGFLPLPLRVIVSKQHVGSRQYRCLCAAWCEWLFLSSVQDLTDETASCVVLYLCF